LERHLSASLEGLGVQIQYLESHDIEALERALSAAPTRLVWLESPSNPLLEIVDLRAAAASCTRHGALLAVDGTATSPCVQRPLDLGAAFVVH
jgi:cystathionine beta-lyase/cystathionine gamma-synthase